MSKRSMYKDNKGNWHYGIEGEKLPEISYSLNTQTDNGGKKMRLIDADELPVFSQIERITENEINYTCWIPAKAIENAPTIEAIPIDWIKHYRYYNGLLAKMVEDWKEWKE